MTYNEIVIGETYFFVGSTSPKRQHLAGTEFTVTDKMKVYRKVKQRRGQRTGKVWRFFNADGIGAKAEELQELPKERVMSCHICGQPAEQKCVRCDELTCQGCLARSVPPESPIEEMRCRNCHDAIRGLRYA